MGDALLVGYQTAQGARLAIVSKRCGGTGHPAQRTSCPARRLQSPWRISMAIRFRMRRSWPRAIGDLHGANAIRAADNWKRCRWRMWRR